ncbi:uncharacterized protein SCHCODRAFT_02694375 [Schizophyllum commune H4-8]|uniref:uncharacterized protein n=1 Tax=Schizophyllum commune (strain H4-8 / FGSC 9210) TaxID=578458 RepID=UPI00215FC740|nr:uncharacterized protein SCHCODRAFT_02694375 [Schizophyllum commune H4-8]KAI5836577.1 hypothetical protein SCHCODRAFT_02694375 [Schizophyllum commune H4-8]
MREQLPMNVIGNYTCSSAASSHSGRGFDQGPICPHVQPTPPQQHCSHSYPLDGALSAPPWMLYTEERPQYFPLALRMRRHAANPSPIPHSCRRRARSESSIPSGVRGHRGCARQQWSSIAMRKRCLPESITPDLRRRRAWGASTGDRICGR